MKRLVALIALLVVESCNLPPKYHRPAPRSANGGGGGAATEGLSGEESSVQDQQTLALTETAGSALRYADSWALTDMYARVFKQRDFGFAHCEKDLPRHPNDCTNVFRPNERPDMGTFDMHEPGINRGPVNIQPVTSLRLSYVRTLRAMLVRECNVLVEKELGNLKAGTAAQNLLIKAAEPKSEDYEFFFKSLLGIEKTTMKVDFDGSLYVEAFKRSMASATDKDAATRATNVAVCVSISMDPHIFLY